MKEIFKLIGLGGKKDIEENRRIRLSRPFFCFYSEGKSFKVLRTIEKLKDNCNEDQLKEKMLQGIHSLLVDYHASLPKDKQADYSEYSDRSDLLIQICQFFQTYCGYFTYENLSDEIVRDKYICKNSSLDNTGDKKVYYVKIPIESNCLNVNQWENKGSHGDFVFYPGGQKDYLQNDNLCGFLKMHQSEYLSTLTSNTIFKNFNGKDRRSLLSHFMYVDSRFEEQSEIRLIFTLLSNKPHERTLACPDQYGGKHCNSIEERLFYDILSAYEYAETFPKNIYLSLKDFEIHSLFGE